MTEKGEPDMTTTTIDEEIVEAGELAHLEEPPAPATMRLFGTDDPELVIARAVKVADVLARVVREKQLFIRIRGEEYVRVEGWTLLGSMLGVFPVVEWTRKLEDGWEARVEARTLDGRVVGAAESECMRSEAKWAKADDYAIRSMAATRATSKALRLPLGFIMKIAGFDPTPAEEITADSAPTAELEPERPRRSRAEPVAVTVEQLEEIQALLLSLRQCDPETDWSAFCRAQAGPLRELTQAGAAILIRKLREQLAERAGDERAEP
jgi:hypothetical protein